MDIIEDYKRYTDKFGLVQPRRDSTSGNGARYTAEYILALDLESRLDAEKERLTKVYNSLMAEPGLLMRTPDNGFGYQSIDDTIGALTASYFLRTNYAQDYLDYGKEKPATSIDLTDTDKEATNKVVWWLLSRGKGSVSSVYNNVHPERFHVSSWLGRFPQLLAHANFAARKTPTIWQQTVWIVSVLMSSFSKGQDAKVLAWHLIQVAKDQSFVCALVGKFWGWMLKKHYPQGIGEVLERYFNNPDHPAAKWLRFKY